MPRKRKRLRDLLADYTRSSIKLISVASDGVPVPGLKGAAAGVSVVWDKFEARRNNLNDEKQARSRGIQMHQQLVQLDKGWLPLDEVEIYQLPADPRSRRLQRAIDQLPDLSEKKKLEQLVRADKYARDIADCNTALDQLHRDVELAVARETLTIAQESQRDRARQEETLQDVLQLTKVFDRQLR
ncbi:hypothetical protein AURDEDRAFT_127053 [Auricularia subglabra TFB-10046 SS5]|nr:hypothetical protein AURDEDRAFT_127053 [Auricularia subglabra TFB-10046 SS5]